MTLCCIVNANRFSVREHITVTVAKSNTLVESDYLSPVIIHNSSKSQIKLVKTKKTNQQCALYFVFPVDA